MIIKFSGRLESYSTLLLVGGRSDGRCICVSVFVCRCPCSWIKLEAKQCYGKEFLETVIGNLLQRVEDK